MAGTKRKASSEAPEIHEQKTTKRAKKNSASSGAGSPTPDTKAKKPVQKKKTKAVSFTSEALPAKLAPLENENADDEDWGADFDAEMERYLREADEAPKSPELEEEEQLPAKRMGGCGRGKGRVEEEEDDLPSLVPAGIDPAMAIAIAGIAYHNNQQDHDQTSSPESPPTTPAINAFDSLLHRTHLAALSRASLRPSSSFPPTATEQKLDGSLSVLPRPTNWDNIYCNQCHAWGRNCFYSQQGCVYKRYEKEVVLGGWCKADCGFCVRMKRE